MLEEGFGGETLADTLTFEQILEQSEGGRQAQSEGSKGSPPGRSKSTQKGSEMETNWA